MRPPGSSSTWAARPGPRQRRRPRALTSARRRSRAWFFRPAKRSSAARLRTASPQVRTCVAVPSLAVRASWRALHRSLALLRTASSSSGSTRGGRSASVPATRRMVSRILAWALRRVSSCFTASSALPRLLGGLMGDGRSGLADDALARAVKREALALANIALTLGVSRRCSHSSTGSPSSRSRLSEPGRSRSR